MARKLQGFLGEEPSAAIAEGVKQVVKVDEVKPVRKWTPLPLKDDGTPDTDKLSPAKVKERVHVRKLPDGTDHMTKETIFLRAGDPAYSVTADGELIAWFKKRGGIGRKMVFQFKKQYRDDDRGKLRKKSDAAFRSVLRKAMVPGA